MKFTDPQGRTLEVNSSDGSIPSERELDQMFSIKYGQSQKPSAYSEYGAPFAHALSLIAGDIPKAIGSRDISPAGQGRSWSREIINRWGCKRHKIITKFSW